MNLNAYINPMVSRVRSKSTSPLTAEAPFLVLDASAGSGKTYSLVQHILMNALRPANMPGAYQKILAITFTNNAADEMKARLLKQLLEFSNESTYPQKMSSFNPFGRPWSCRQKNYKFAPQQELSTCSTITLRCT